MSVKRGKGVAAVKPNEPSDRRRFFLSNGPIILFNFSIFLPSSIGAFQPFVARGRRRRSRSRRHRHRTTSSSFAAKRSESFTILGVQVEVPSLSFDAADSWPPVVFIVARYLFLSTPTPFSTNCSKGRLREKRGG